MEHSTVATIDRRQQLPYEEFAEEYLFPGKPVIITGGVRGWRALDNWTPDYFKSKYGSMNLRIDDKNYTMADFIDSVNSSSSVKPAPYLRNEIIEQFLPELLADISPLPRYFFPNWLDGRLSRVLRSRLHNGSPELYIGGSGANSRSFILIATTRTLFSLRSTAPRNTPPSPPTRLPTFTCVQTNTTHRKYPTSSIQISLNSRSSPTRYLSAFASIPEKFSSFPADYGTPPRC
jgi:hypothetical protein